jgi:hypothetical protein
MQPKKETTQKPIPGKFKGFSITLTQYGIYNFLLNTYPIKQTIPYEGLEQVFLNSNGELCIKKSILERRCSF